MRSTLLLVGIALLAAFALAPAADARPSPVCTNETSGTCLGLVCVDENLDGKFSYDECVIMYCPEYGCCDFDCPPPYWE